MPPKKRVCNYVHPKQHSPFPNRLRLPYPDEEILSGHEKDVSFIRDGFTSWVKADFETILERHAVDIKKAHAEFREASARKHDTSYQEYHFDNNVPSCSPVPCGPSSTTGTKDPDAQEKALSRSKSHGNGTSLPCRSRLSMLTTSFSRIGSMGPIVDDVHCCSMRTLSFPTSKSNPSTFTIPGASCRTRCLKENRVG